MKSEDIDWKSGKVVYWDMETIDPAKPAAEQLDELKEDLAQISFADDRLLDIGWYPEFSADGSFRVTVIRDANWQEPLWEKRYRTVQELLTGLADALAAAEGRAL